MGLLTGIRSSIANVTDRLFADETPKRIGIYGPPNAGKCLAPDEEVVLADGTTARIESVFNDIVASENDPTDVSDEPHEEWIPVEQSDVRVPSLRADLRPTTGEVTHVFRQRYAGPLYTVKTETGRTVRVSPEHPFVTGTDFTPARDLEHRQSIAVVDPEPTFQSPQPGVLTDGGTRTTVAPAMEDAAVTGWDDVASIDVEHYSGYIYDLTVADHHTFTTGDGLVVHNTTLANRIAKDWTGDEIGAESHVPHETREATRKENVEIKRNGSSVTIDIVDTPGVTTKVDYEEFLEFDIEEDDAIARSREATEGVAEAMHWLREDIDGVIYVLDSAQDPFTQVNTMLIGIIESRELPVLIFANKIDLEDSNVQRISSAFPQHETVPLSALEGDNMDEVYDQIAEYFG